MSKVRVKSNIRSNQAVVYYGGEYLFDENGITEVEEDKVKDLLGIHDDLSIHIDNIVSTEVAETVQPQSKTYEQELMDMTKKELSDLAKEIGLSEEEVKLLNKQKLVGKILSKI